MKVLVGVIMLALSSGCATVDPWTRADSVLYGVYVTSLVTDGVTTSRIKDYPCIREAGPAAHVLGTQPGSTETALYFGTLAVTNFFIARWMSSDWRKLWLGGNAIAHGSAAYSNRKLQSAGCP